MLNSLAHMGSRPQQKAESVARGSRVVPCVLKTTMVSIRSRRRCVVAVVALELSSAGVNSFLGPVLGGGACVRASHRQLSPSSLRLTPQPNRLSRGNTAVAPRMSASVQIESFPYSDVLPFLSEHVQPSDQMLVMGCMSELPLQLSRDGYGTRDSRSLIRCIDSNPERIATMKAAAEADPACLKNMKNGKLTFEVLDVTGGMPELEQSCVDCVVDAGLLDELVITQGVEAARACSDAGHRAVRLGNPLVALSKIDKDDFAAIFDGNFGWMQELDGDPGAISQWYRNEKINVKDVTNNFKSLGLSFFVYTNVDNC